MPRSRAPGPGKGGPRQGNPGQAYPNRSDLTQPGAAPQPASAPSQATMTPGRGYGTPQPTMPPKQENPAGLAPVSPGASPPAAAAAAAPAGMGGAQPPPLMRPTDRPQEPLTAGVPHGPGPNTMQMPALPAQDTLGLFLRELYRAQPNEDVRQLILQYEGQANKAPSGPLPLQGPLQQQGPPSPVGPQSPMATPTVGGPPAGSPVGEQAGAPQGLTNG